ncbi:MAG: hypothetical protein ACLSWA_01205 [Thomasclavelia spiroformis]
MAYGFFCSLIIGTIFKQIGNFANISQLAAWGEVATYLMGSAIEQVLLMQSMLKD